MALQSVRNELQATFSRKDEGFRSGNQRPCDFFLNVDHIGIVLGILFYLGMLRELLEVFQGNLMGDEPTLETVKCFPKQEMIR